MGLFSELIDREVPELHEEGVQIRFIGRIADLDPELRARIAAAEELTAGNTRLRLFVAMNYGSRREIVDAARRFAAECGPGGGRGRVRPVPLRARTCATPSWSSAPAASSASPTSCCGSARTRSCTSRPGCGRISPPRTSTSRSRSTGGATAASVVAERFASSALTSRLVVAVPGVIARDRWSWRSGARCSPLVLAAIGVLGLYELYSLLAATRPLRWAGYLGTLCVIGLAWGMDDPEHGILLGLGLSLGFVAVAGLILPRRDDITVRVATTLLGVVYLGLPLALLVSMRELPHGAAAIVCVLVGVWIFDTASYVGGRLWGRRPIAPLTSPKKTVEGAAVGLVVATLAVWIAGLYMDWIDGWQSLILGPRDLPRGLPGRPLRVDDQARRRRQGLGPPADGPRRACSTASTRSCSAARSPTSSSSGSSTEEGRGMNLDLLTLLCETPGAPGARGARARGGAARAGAGRRRDRG